MPPGLKRYWQTHSRSGGKKRKKGSTAMTVYRGGSPAVRTVTKTVVIKSKRKGHGRGRSARHMGGFETATGFNLADMRPAGISALIGYSEAGKGFSALQDLLDKIPEAGKAPKEAIAGLIAYWFREKSDWIADAAVAFLNIGGYKLGQQGFAIKGDDD
jgi:hypothetical protein